ncbi:MAG: crosslink repair DNA glycosylase YcaQ family protein [Candidatus Thorarchaeota archaeon]
MIELNLEQARSFILDRQGLNTNSPSKSVMAVAKRIHNIQIDTISVVSRSHNVTTFNRFENYKEGQVWREVKSGKLFEFWSHAMCMMPTETYPYYKWKANILANRTKGWPIEWGAKNPEVVEEVYKHVETNGATASRSMGGDESQRGGWWNWKAEKHALEYLFTTGRLMVASREGFQKHYDLTERVLPASIASEPLSDDEAAKFSVMTTIKSLGLASWEDMKFYTGGLVYQKMWRSTKKMVEFLDMLVDEGLLSKVLIDEIPVDYYSLAKDATRVKKCQPTEKGQYMKFLCPFDNLIRERHLPRKLWSFDYKIESYTPKPERQYGYYVLPILDETEFVGRMDSKVHRDRGVFEVKSLFLESNNWSDSEVQSRFQDGLRRFALFHGCEAIEVTDVRPKKYLKPIKSLIEKS